MMHIPATYLISISDTNGRRVLWHKDPEPDHETVPRHGVASGKRPRRHNSPEPPDLSSSTSRRP